MKTKCFADNRHSYAFKLLPQGWRNQGMVSNRDFATWEELYKKADFYNREPAEKVAFVPFCWNEDPNVMTEEEIREFGAEIY